MGPCQQSLGIPSRVAMLAGKSLCHARPNSGLPCPVGQAPLRRAPRSPVIIGSIFSGISSPGCARVRELRERVCEGGAAAGAGASFSEPLGLGSRHYREFSASFFAENSRSSACGGAAASEGGSFSDPWGLGSRHYREFSASFFAENSRSSACGGAGADERCVSLGNCAMGSRHYREFSDPFFGAHSLCLFPPAASAPAPEVEEQEDGEEEGEEEEEVVAVTVVVVGVGNSGVE